MIWDIKYLKKETKDRIYKRIVRPILICAAETGTEKTKTESILEFSKTVVLRKIFNKTGRDSIKTEEIDIILMYKMLTNG